MGNLKSGGIINSHDSDADHIIIGVPFDGTSSGAKGADKGPAAIKAMLEHQVERYHQLLGHEPCEYTNIAWLTADIRENAKQPIEQMIDSVRDLCASCRTLEQSFTIVGGEHSVTIPALAAYARFNEPSEVTIVQIDAHLDLRDIDEYNEKPFGGNAHCCVMRRAEERGFKIVNIGARSYSRGEMAYARRNHETIRVFSPLEKDISMHAVIRAIKTDKVWVSIDADGICPGDMPATGTPVGGGVSLDFVRRLLFQIATHKHHIIGADVVEVAPPLDPTSNLTAYNAAQLVYELIGYQRRPGCHAGKTK
jgi:agmatinase